MPALDQAASDAFTKQIGCDFRRSVARQRWLTISGIGVGETQNPQSLQGVLPNLGPAIGSFYFSSSGKTKTHERVS
jgi:hypothetical protein